MTLRGGRLPLSWCKVSVFHKVRKLSFCVKMLSSPSKKISEILFPLFFFTLDYFSFSLKLNAGYKF